MITSSKITLPLFAVACVSLASGHPAAALTTLTAGGSSVYGTTTSSYFQPTYGTQGYIEFATTTSGQTAGNYQFSNNTFAADTGSNPQGTTIISQPSYISALNGFNVSQAAGYGHPDISTGHESGLVGYSPGNGGGNIFSFTVGTASSFTFSVLANYSQNTGEYPTLVTLTESGSPSSVPLFVSDPGSATASPATAYLFDISNASPGEIFTISTDQGYISGAAFDPLASAAPEPAETETLGLVISSTICLLLIAKKRRMKRVV